jgi:hypothetical protein
MIASAQKSITSPLPWHLFRGLAAVPGNVPVECPVLATQLHFLKGFLYACPGDVLSEYQGPVSLRVGFSIQQLHFVVVLPLLEAERVIRTSGVQLPIWPLDLEILVHYENFPTITVPADLINFLTGLVQVALCKSDQTRLNRMTTHNLLYGS